MTTRRERPAAYTRDRARAELHEVYAQLPTVHCKGLCSDSCSTTDGTPLERALVADAGVELPPGVPHALHLQLIATGVHLRCPALSAIGTCTVYGDRPLLCRSFGAIRSGACEHGCSAERWLSVEDLGQVMDQVWAVNARWEAAGRP